MENRNLSCIHPDAKIAENVIIGPFVTIEADVEIGEGTEIQSGAVILNGSRIGKNCRIHSGAVIGGLPQDLKFRGEETTAEVGDNNTIRENVTINRGTAAKGRTVVGSNNLLMEGMHVAHDVLIGNGCIIGNATKLAGEVVVDDFAIISAAVLVHQFCHIGSYVMVGGGTRTGQDVPPYCMAARDPVAYCGLNLVGLRRRGFSREAIDTIHKTYNILYQSGKLLKESIAQIREEIPACHERDYILEFIESSTRGFIRPA